MTASSLKVKGTGADLYVGTAGWSYDDWQGIVYPRGIPSTFRGLRFLAEHYGFNTVELNNTFYRPPKPSYCRAWLEDVEGRPDFSFTVKLWRRFTHEREERWSREEVEVFRKGIAPIIEAGRLGALLVQFPWSFRFNEAGMDWLARLAEEFGDLPLVLEVRSRDWLQHGALDFIAGLGLGFCNIDQPGLRSNVPLTAHAFGRIGYLRLHGRNREKWFAEGAGRDQRYNYLYGPEELQGIAETARRIARKVERLYVITNNHYRGQAPANALQLAWMLAGVRGEPPRPLADHYNLS